MRVGLRFLDGFPNMKYMLQEIMINKDITTCSMVGNIKIDCLLKDFEEPIKSSHSFSQELFSVHPLTSTVSIVYQYKDALLLDFDPFNGYLMRIIAISGYKGGLAGKIFVGQKVRDLLKFDSSFKPYATGGLMSPNYLGICIYMDDRFDMDLHDVNSVLDNEITGIGVIRQFNENGDDVFFDIYGPEHPDWA